jgi:hypothetical protein
MIGLFTEEAAVASIAKFPVFCGNAAALVRTSADARAPAAARLKFVIILSSLFPVFNIC